MKIQIASAAEVIWRELDRYDGIRASELCSRLEKTGLLPEVIKMGLGWLLYARYVKWVPDVDGARLFLIGPGSKETPGMIEELLASKN